MNTEMTQRKNYRFLTGPDDAAFCQRVSDALAEGYVLYCLLYTSPSPRDDR